MKFRPLFVVIALLYVVCASAQSRYRFFTLTMEQGLTSDYAWAVCQDKFNYIWIGTANGLNRYDGHSTKQYFHNSTDSFSIPGNTIYWIYKDPAGDMWFSLGHRGVAKYDYAKDRFERFHPFDSIKKANDYAAPLWRMANDAKGRLYFACGAACFRYNPGTRKMEDITPLFNDAIKNVGVGMFIPKGPDTLWILTGNGLFNYDLKNERIVHVPFDANKLGFGTAEMHDGEYINDHEMLISVSRAGFVLFDTRTWKFRLPPEPFDPTSSKKFSETGGVLKDSKGRIWIANSRFGLLEYFPSRNVAYSLKNEHSYPYPYAEQEGNGLNVYEDKDGYIWYCSSNRGVMWFNPKADYIQAFVRDYSKTSSLPGNAITYFHELAKDKILIGTNNGITEFNPLTNSFRNFSVALSDKDTSPHPFIRAMLQRGDSILITTYKGLSIYNTRSGKFSRFYESNEIADSVFIYGIWLLHYTAPGEVMVTGNNASRFHLNTGKYEFLDKNKPDALYSLSDINASMYDESNGNLWIEADTGKLYLYNTYSRHLTNQVYTNDRISMIDAIAKDKSGNIWLGTTGGLFKYNPATKQSEKIVLNTRYNDVYNIIINNSEYIWLTTPKEIVRYNPHKNTVEVISINTILPNCDIMKRAFMLSSDGFLHVGTNKGFCRIDTRRFTPEKRLKEPQLVKFSVFENEKPFGETFQQLDKIVLSHNENFFSFAMSSFDYRIQSTVRYGYMLEGFDKDWQDARGNLASYTNVPPGKYKLHLRSSIGGGGWIQRAIPVAIVVTPPFWQTWWFILIAVLVAVFSAIGIYKFIRAKKKAEDKARETKRESELQLLEIRKLLAESQLMALRAQMNPHFVFNCLNSIQECIVTQKYGEASLYLNKFSKLFRSVLNNSGRVMITLAEEIEVLELYLSLEHMRFEKSFEFTIEAEEDMETDEILIPSMLLQPYVENALWHGLMHKQGNRQLSISFKKVNEDVFQCTVDDNGIGRKKALELKEQQSKTKRHVSKGMSIANDRIDLLQKQGHHAVLKIIDKYDDHQNATGTRVVIELSTYLKA